MILATSCSGFSAEGFRQCETFLGTERLGCFGLLNSAIALTEGNREIFILVLRGLNNWLEWRCMKTRKDGGFFACFLKE